MNVFPHRFTTQYENSGKIIGKVMNICLLSKSYFSTADSWRMMRYANAAHLVGYVGLSDVYSDSNTFKPINQIQKLLNSDEIKRLEDIGVDNGGSCCGEVICWMLDLLSIRSKEIEDSNRMSIPLSSSQLYFILHEEILQLRGFIALLFGFRDQPLPFVYLHSLVLSISMFLPICCYAVATNLFTIPTAENYIYEPLGLFVLSMLIFFFEGLKCISHQLMDPYGDDLHDLSVFHYINNAVLNSRKLMSSMKMASKGPQIELNTDNYRPPIGQGYSDGDTSMCAFSCLDVEVPTKKVCHFFPCTLNFINLNNNT